MVYCTYVFSLRILSPSQGCHCHHQDESRTKKKPSNLSHWNFWENFGSPKASVIRQSRTFKPHGCYTMTVCVSTNGAPFRWVSMVADPMKLNLRETSTFNNRRNGSVLFLTREGWTIWVLQKCLLVRPIIFIEA